MEPRYDHKSVEPKIYDLWEKSGFFNPDKLPVSKPYTLNPKPFTVIMPPPNVTGSLHIGHAVFMTLQDILIRFNRMCGKKTLWLPGTDHAAIATSVVVERELQKKEGKTRHYIGREAFTLRAQQFSQESRDTIIHQLKSWGASADWSREAYTLDEKRNLAVRTAFKRMYDDGLIYRGARIVNWDPKLQTTVSDDEIDWKEEKANLYYLKYGPFTIATARPETKFGDKYVVMHPRDPQYKNYKDGQKIDLEWINGPITATVVKDSVIDMEFGTGVMTITPAHDATDFEIAKRHNLDKPQVIDESGKLLPIAGEFTGMYISKARPLIVEKLKEKGLLEKVDENYTHRIATNSRGGELIEPQIKEQWFVDVHRPFVLQSSKFPGLPPGSLVNLKLLMHHVVDKNMIRIIPDYFEKIYFHWIDNLRDWCISRQIWFGHRIPVWYCGHSNVKRMGFASATIESLRRPKGKTYRVEGYGFNIGDDVVFEDTKTGKAFGRAIITNIEFTTIGKIDLKDGLNRKTYDSYEELINELNSYRPPALVTAQSPVWIYSYELNEKLIKGNCGTIIVSVDDPKECPTCGSNKLEQDPDTLDTWFSSGLWTFSTLGWPASAHSATAGRPGPENDLANFHPTDVLETGYDILFFWVARMILMTTYNLGDIPFRTVYLHGLVRDKDRQKMSKSKGNVIDPLGVAEIYGTDAVRMALVVGNLPGQDVVISEDKIRGYRNFATKIWNAARFVLGNFDEQFKTITPEFTADDNAALQELKETHKKITDDLENFRFHHAAETAYHYFWHTFADKIIEVSKPRFKSKNLTDRATAFALNLEILQTALKFLHPFMPFITEEIYQKLPIPKKKLLMIESW